MAQVVFCEWCSYQGWASGYYCAKCRSDNSYFEKWKSVELNTIWVNGTCRKCKYEFISDGMCGICKRKDERLPLDLYRDIEGNKR